jgi:hypothetical protein
VNRAVLHFWPTAVRGIAPVLLLVGVSMVIGWPFSVLGFLAGLFALAGAWWRCRWTWKLAAVTRDFRTVTTPFVHLHYSPRLRDPLMIRAFHRTAEAELHSLARRFGRPLRIPIAVYVFAETRQVSQVFGPQYGGFALWGANAIVLAVDCVWDEFVRHELSHLFAGRWSKLVPPLLQEGLAVWLQGTHYGRRIDDAARAVLGRRDVGLDLLMDRDRFFSPECMSDCYTLAGSFTGFLVRRFGWEAYERLYRRCDGTRFQAKFRKCFRLSLEDAHWEWRLELRLGD